MANPNLIGLGSSTPSTSQPRRESKDSHAEMVKAFMEGNITVDLIKYFNRKRMDMMLSFSEDDFIKEDADLFVYEGFDPNVIWGRLVQIEPDESVLKSDIGKMILVFLMRGNNVGKMVDSMPQRGSVIVRNLTAKYGIKNRLDHLAKKSTITLARVALTLPFVAMVASHKLHVNYMRPIREYLGKLHCFLRLSCATSYYTISFAPHVYWLHIAYLIVLGSCIGKKEDTLGKLRGFINAAVDAPKLAKPVVEDYMRANYLHVEPQGWNAIRNVIESTRDDTKLSEIVPQIEDFFARFQPPHEWGPYTIQLDYEGGGIVSRVFE